MKKLGEVLINIFIAAILGVSIGFLIGMAFFLPIMLTLLDSLKH